MDSNCTFYTFDDIKNHLAGYLSSSDQIKLVAQIKQTYPNIDYYRENSTNDFLLQGDGWTEFELFDFDSVQKHIVSGFILSNTCDISPDNKRLVHPNIVFATCVQMEKYESMLQVLQDKQRVKNHIEAIRNQAVTNRFFLPATTMQKDFVVLLDDIHNMPLKRFQAKANKRNAVHLSNAGYYVFILKLAIHFCRLTDGENRSWIATTLK